MAEEKLVAIAITNEKGTPLRSMEGQLEVEYKYKGEEEFTKVVDEVIDKGVYKTDDGKVPSAEAGKEIEEEKVKFTPKVEFGAFYSARTSVYKAQAEKLLQGPDSKFEIETKKLTKEELKEQREKIKDAELARLKSKLIDSE